MERKMKKGMRTEKALFLTWPAHQCVASEMQAWIQERGDVWH
jgi:hypothetical protein